jgi:hypothetical protein
MENVLQDVDMGRDAVVNLRMPTALKELARRAAVDDSRSLSTWIMLAMQRRLAELGYVDPSDQPIRRAKKGA